MGGDIHYVIIHVSLSTGVASAVELGSLYAIPYMATRWGLIFDFL